MEVLFQLRKNTHLNGLKKGESKNNVCNVVLTEYHRIVCIIVAKLNFMLYHCGLKSCLSANKHTNTYIDESY